MARIHYACANLDFCETNQMNQTNQANFANQLKQIE